MGRLTPVGPGRPSLSTVGGVAAVSFGGSESLRWDQATWDSLDGNRAWSVDLWAFKAAAAADGEQTLVEWGTAAAPGARLTWGGTGTSIELPGGVRGQWTSVPAPRRWHHLAWVYTGGGVDDGPGECRVYVDGKLDHTLRAKLDLPAKSSVTVGAGFTGALGHVRIYNYDLHPLQLREIWTGESPAHQAEPATTAGNLLVALDARLLAPPADPESWPHYPASLNKPWLRSWTNRGTLGGKLHNDGRRGSASRPMAGVARGVEAITFDGRSRMISSFTDSPPADGSVEAWVFPEPGGDAGTVLQWGAWSLPAKLLRPGAWQHLAMTCEKGDVRVFINAAPVPTSGATLRHNGSTGRFILGGAWDGKAWGAGFLGHLAEIRVHSGVLTAEQILQNVTRSSLLRPSRPSGRRW